MENIISIQNVCKNFKDIKVLNFGAKKEFTDSISLDELYERYHLKEDLIISDIQNIL